MDPIELVLQVAAPPAWTQRPAAQRAREPPRWRPLDGVHLPAPHRRSSTRRRPKACTGRIDYARGKTAWDVLAQQTFRRCHDEAGGGRLFDTGGARPVFPSFATGLRFVLACGPAATTPWRVSPASCGDPSAVGCSRVPQRSARRHGRRAPSPTAEVSRGVAGQARAASRGAWRAGRKMVVQSRVATSITLGHQLVRFQRESARPLIVSPRPRSPSARSGAWRRRGRPPRRAHRAARSSRGGRGQREATLRSEEGLRRVLCGERSALAADAFDTMRSAPRRADPSQPRDGHHPRRTTLVVNACETSRRLARAAAVAVRTPRARALGDGGPTASWHLRHDARPGRPTRQRPAHPLDRDLRPSRHASCVAFDSDELDRIVRISVAPRRCSGRVRECAARALRCRPSAPGKRAPCGCSASRPPLLELPRVREAPPGENAACCNVETGGAGTS